ncbi:hypothetical protein G6F35_018995 [Rhizopus arrhizus]|nr:hypothetical protein G6F35_018995 [Rhizopus arrhizus]
MDGSLARSMTVSCSLRITSGGVPAGAMTPYQDSTTASFTPASANVGTSGIAGLRCSLATASTRTLPGLM